MQKTVKMIAKFVSEIAEEFAFSDVAAMHILEAAAGGIENVAEFVEEAFLDEVEESPDSCESEDYDVVDSTMTYVGSRNRITIPRLLLKQAEEINGKLESKKNDYGALTIIPDATKRRYTILFGDHVAEYDDARVCYPNSRGQVQFSARGIYCEGNSIDILLYKDGKIVID